MTDFTAKTHHTRFRQGIRPRPICRSSQHSPIPLAKLREAEGVTEGLTEREGTGNGFYSHML